MYDYPYNCTIIEGALICTKHLTPEQLLQTYNCYGDYYYGAFVDIALKADIDFDFIRMYSPRNSKTMKRINFDFWGNKFEAF